MNRFGAAAEFKFASDPATGAFEGYAAVFGNTDSHGDVIRPGAFADSLAQHKAANTMPALYVEHGPAFGGDALPSGVWNSLVEDDTGLKGQGKISALDTDHGRRLRGLMQDGAMRGLSIGYRVQPGGSMTGTKAGEPRRTLTKLGLIEVSIVRDPSNPLAKIDQIKAALFDGGMPSIREFEEALREQGFSRKQAEVIASHGYKAVLQRDVVGDAEAKSLTAMLQGFKLP